MSVPLSGQFIVDIARNCNVDVGSNAIPVCEKAAVSFADKLLCAASQITQYCSRIDMHASDVAYALRVIADTDRAGLGAVYGLAKDGDAAKAPSAQIGRQSSRKRSFTDSELEHETVESGSCYTLSSIDNSDVSGSETSSGLEDEFSEILSDTEVPKSIFPDDTLIRISSSTVHIVSDVSNAPDVDFTEDFWILIPLIQHFCLARNVDLSLFQSAYTMFKEVLMDQIELSFSGMPSVIVADLGSSKASLRTANEILNIVNSTVGLNKSSSEISQSRSSFTPSSNSSRVNTTTSGSSLSKITSSGPSILSSSSGSLPNLRTVGFNLDTSVIPEKIRSSVDAECVSADISLSSVLVESDVDRSIGLTPYFSRRALAADREDISPDRYLLQNTLGSSVQLTEMTQMAGSGGILSPQFNEICTEKVELSPNSSVRGDAVSDFNFQERFIFEALSPIIATSPNWPSDEEEQQEH